MSISFTDLHICKEVLNEWPNGIRETCIHGHVTVGKAAWTLIATKFGLSSQAEAKTYYRSILVSVYRV